MTEATTATPPPHPVLGADEAFEIVQRVRAGREAIESELRKRIVGQDDVVRLMLVSLFARGHCLFIGVPGLAKTLLIATLSEALSLEYKRIQFTPDLMPADITGTEILEEDHSTGKRFFRFIKGPIFCNMLLADEVNRTPPKTQAALLQAMQEYEVTAAGQSHALERPFLVFATQNPIEQEGTYPLPEAQLDRFMFKIDVGYPEADEEVEIVKRTTGSVSAPVEAVAKKLEIALTSGDADTMSGLVTALLERVPAVGDRVELPGASAEVLEVVGARATQLRVVVDEGAAPGAPA